MKKKQAINRRGFLRTSLLSSGALLATQGLSTANSSGKFKLAKTKPILRSLGNTGIELPVVSAGKLPATNPQLTIEAYNRGIQYFDTAWLYDQGTHEVMLGKTLTQFDRSSYYVGTKIVLDCINNSTGELEGEFNREQFFERFDESMKRLNMEYVDIVYFHKVKKRSIALLPEVMECFTTLKRSGRAKHIGISTHSNEPEVLQAAIDSKFYEIVLTSYNFKQSHLPELEKKIKAAAEAGIGILGMKVMAGGFLDKEKTKPINYTAAMKWALQNPHITTLIPQMKNFDQLDTDTKVLYDIELSPLEKKDLEEAKELAGLYCDGCHQCVDQCPHKLAIPELMRSYMYSYGYSENLSAKDVVSKVLKDGNPCEGCSGCTVTCPKGFQIAEKVADISRIYDIPRDFLV